MLQPVDDEEKEEEKESLLYPTYARSPISFVSPNGTPAGQLSFFLLLLLNQRYQPFRPK